MTITTAQSVPGLYNVESAGTPAVLPQTGPQSSISVAFNNVSPSSPGISAIGATIGIQFTTAGFDPVAVYLLTVTLRTTGQIWPIAPN